MQVMKKRCDKCYYWVEKKFCYRYPKIEAKNSDDWCGCFLENKGIDNDNISPKIGELNSAEIDELNNNIGTIITMLRKSDNSRELNGISSSQLSLESSLIKNL